MHRTARTPRWRRQPLRNDRNHMTEPSLNRGKRRQDHAAGVTSLSQSNELSVLNSSLCDCQAQISWATKRAHSELVGTAHKAPLLGMDAHFLARLQVSGPWVTNPVVKLARFVR